MVMDLCTGYHSYFKAARLAHRDKLNTYTLLFQDQDQNSHQYSFQCRMGIGFPGPDSNRIRDGSD